MSTNLRQPSIHITENNLRSLVRQYFGDPEQDYRWDEANTLVDFIMENSVKLSLEKRSLFVDTKKIAERATKKLVNDKTDIMLLSNLIFSVRKQLRHKGIKPIDNNSTEWVSLKKLSPLINNFCNDFNLPKREGYLVYIRIGLSRISSFRGYINKLYDMSETISNQYEAEKIISDDPNKILTQKLHDYYISLIVKRTGINENYLDKPNKYVNFVKVANIIESQSLNYRVFIEAQFEGLDWTGNYPEPEQLASDKCIERLNKYMYSSKGKEQLAKESGKADSKLTNVLNKIKNGKNSH